MQHFVPGDSTRSPVDILSDREMEILQLIGNAVSSNEIADQLKLSVKTVESHRLHIRDKLQFSGGADLNRFAVSWAERNRK